MTSSIEMAINTKRHVINDMHLEEIGQIVGKMNIECARHGSLASSARVFARRRVFVCFCAVVKI